MSDNESVGFVEEYMAAHDKEVCQVVIVDGKDIVYRSKAIYMEEAVGVVAALIKEIQNENSKVQRYILEDENNNMLFLSLSRLKFSHIIIQLVNEKGSVKH